MNCYARHRANSAFLRHPFLLLNLYLLTPFLFAIVPAILLTAAVMGVAFWQDLIIAYPLRSNGWAVSMVAGVTMRDFIVHASVMGGGMMLISIISCGANQGLTLAMLQVVRGDRPRFRTLFSRMDSCLKALLIQLSYSLKAVLIYLICLVGATLLRAFLSNWLSDDLLVSACMLAAFLLGTWNYRRNSLAPFFLADHPDMPALEALERSRIATRKRVIKLLLLELPYVLGMIAVTWVATMISPLLLVSLLPLSLLIALANAAFYDQVRPQSPKEAPQEDSSPSEEPTEEEPQEEDPAEETPPGDNAQEPPDV